MRYATRLLMPSLLVTLPTLAAAQRTDATVTLPSPATRSVVLATLPGADFHAEGVAWDPRSRRVFVGSVRHGEVVLIDGDGAVRPFLRAGTDGLRAVFGVLADTARNLLWISSADVRERAGGMASPRAPSSVSAYSLSTGHLVRRWGFPEDGRTHLIGELVLAPDGTVWGSDSEAPGIYRVPMAEGRELLERLPFDHPTWRSPQGLAFGDDGRSAWLADWSRGLFHLDLRTHAVTPVAVPAEESLRGIDGLYHLGGGHLIAIQNGTTPFRIAALDLDSAGTRVRTVRVLDHPPGPGEPTLGVVTAEGLRFVAGSLWPFYDATGRLQPGPLPPSEIRLLPWR